jgi:hypothetical protein
MSKYIFAVKSSKGGSSTGQQSELVKLGILKKDVFEYTNADIGSTILIPYNDESGKISLNNGCIEFEVVGVNHHKDVNDESKPTITLMTKNIIRYIAFDAQEPNNPLFDERYEDGYNGGGNARAEDGNNHWSVSNIRQWLNSEAAAGEWFTAQHEYDEAPTVDNTWNDGEYADEPGFLAGFSTEIKQHFADIKNTTAIPDADGGGWDITVDKVFLPSYTEMGYGLNDGTFEGSHLSVRYPDNNSRIKTGNGLEIYWTRSPVCDRSNYVYRVYPNGDWTEEGWACSGEGLAPIIVLC